MAELTLEKDANGSLTMRGRRAASFLNDLRSVTVDTLRLGDRVRQAMLDGEVGYFRVIWVGQEGEHILIVMLHPKFGKIELRRPPGSKVRIGWPPEIKIRQLVMAIDYQNTLNQWGKPIKGVNNVEQQAA